MDKITKMVKMVVYIDVSSTMASIRLKKKEKKFMKF